MTLLSMGLRVWDNFCYVCRLSLRRSIGPRVSACARKQTGCKLRLMQMITMRSDQTCLILLSAISVTRFALICLRSLVVQCAGIAFILILMVCQWIVFSSLFIIIINVREWHIFQYLRMRQVTFWYFVYVCLFEVHCHSSQCVGIA